MEAAETVVAESSPAVVEAPATPEKPAIDPLQEGPMVTWTREQRNEFRATGKTPETPKAAPKPKVEEAAPSSQTKEPFSESAGAPETPPKQQENTGKPASKQSTEERFRVLTEHNRQLKAELDAERAKSKPSPESEPKPKPAEAPQPQYTRPKPKPDGMNQDGKPYETYEDYVEDLANWSGEQKLAQYQRQQREEAQARAFAEKISEAKSRYKNFDDVIEPTAEEINSDPKIPQDVKRRFGKSPLLADLVYLIGNKPEAKAEFFQLAHTDSDAAISWLAVSEYLIKEDFAKQASSKSTEEAASEESPAKHQTSAPKPPAEVGGRGSAPPDAMEAALKANDFRAVKAEINRRELARRKTG